MLTKQRRDSVVFIDGYANLRYRQIIPGSLFLYSEDTSELNVPKENVDFVVDYENGSMTAISDKIRDYHTCSFYGIHNFDHTKYENFGNAKVTYYADYIFDNKEQSSDSILAEIIMKDSPKIQRLTANNMYLVYGDSISTGLEASAENYTYFSRFKCTLEKTFGVALELVNNSNSGDTSDDGVKNFNADIIPPFPGIATIAFGMNDQNVGANGHFVEPDRYEENIRTMIESLKKRNYDIILISPCLPNPRWMYTSGDAILYSYRLKKLSEEYTLPFANVTELWLEILKRKTPESLLHNDINHPNDYGHTLYADALTALIALH